LFGDRDGSDSSQEDKERDKREPEPVPSFTKSHAAHRTVNSFLYVNRTGECDKHVTF